MMNLKVCTDPPLDYFEAISREKDPPRREQLLALLDTIAKAYESYRATCPSLESLPALPLTEEAQENLLHCYNSRTKHLSLLKARIKGSQSAVLKASCQYCMLDTPGTYDHYLPKAEYPEFSVCSLNLVLCCADCNLRRKDAWRNDKGERQHVHLYCDAIDQSEEVLFADIHFAKVPSATFRLELTKVHSKPFYQLLDRHFTQLKLLERYGLAAPVQMSEHHRTIRELSVDLTPARIADVFRRQLAADIKAWGPHHWKVALLRAVCDTPRFIQFALDTSLSIWEEQEAP